MSSFQRHANDSYEPFEAGTVNWLRQDDQIQAGFWACTPEQQPNIYEAEFKQNETIYILEGNLEVEIVGGTTHRLGPGDSASFLKGTTGRWKVITPLREFFIYS